MRNRWVVSPEDAALNRNLVEALRAWLGLQPLYDKERKSDLERFGQTYPDLKDMNPRARRSA